MTDPKHQTTGHHGHHHHDPKGGGHKFDPANLEKLKNPERLDWLKPERVWETLCERLGGQIPGTVVDVGAGIGFFALPFARHMSGGTAGGTVYGTDIREDMLDLLRGVLEHEQVTNVEPLLTEEVAIPLEAGFADVVFMSNLHHELDHPVDSLCEALRLLRSGGVIAVIDWKLEETPSGPPPEVRVTPETVKAQFAEAGFTNVVTHDLLPYHYFLTAVKP